MNPSSEDDAKSNQETQALDPLLSDEEETVPPVLNDDEKEKAEKGETGELGEDKERDEVVTKEAMLRVTGGQL